jgi:predicted dehydrogenase
MKKVQGAVIGLGKMGLSHAAIVGAHPLVELTAICDTSRIVLEGFKRFSQVKTYSNFQKMLDNEQLDFVIVATPTRSHHEIVLYALNRGIHVFCEKPFALHYREGRELVELASQKSLVNQVGYHNHFIGTFRELKRLLKRNVLGDLLHFSGEAYGPVVVKEKVGTWRSKAGQGGGCLYDYASHVLNLIQEVVGRPESIKGKLLKSFYSKNVEDAVYALLELQNKISGTLLVNWSDETYRKMSTSITVFGVKGKIVCDATELKIYLKEANAALELEKGWTTKYITDLAVPVQYYLRGEEYSAQLDYFIDNVVNERHGTINTFEQALYTDKIIEDIVSYAS